VALSSPRWPYALAVAGLAAAFAGTWLLLGTLSAVACSGDGGVLYAAPASTVGALCEAREHGWLVVPWAAGLLAAPVTLLGCGVAAVVRRDWRLLLAGAAAATALLLAVTLPFLALPSECSSAQRASMPDERCEVD
jgi:hypothetical protein